MPSRRRRLRSKRDEAGDLVLQPAAPTALGGIGQGIADDAAEAVGDDIGQGGQRRVAEAGALDRRAGGRGGQPRTGVDGALRRKSPANLLGNLVQPQTSNNAFPSGIRVIKIPQFKCLFKPFQTVLHFEMPLFFGNRNKPQTTDCAATIFKIF